MSVDSLELICKWQGCGEIFGSHPDFCQHILEHLQVVLIKLKHMQYVIFCNPNTKIQAQCQKTFCF